MKKETPELDDKELWELKEPIPANILYRNQEDITDRVKYPPRVVSVYLHSDDAVSKQPTEISWFLHYGRCQPFRQGTVLYINSWARMNTSSERIEIGLSGINVESYNSDQRLPCGLIAQEQAAVVEATEVWSVARWTNVCATLLDLDCLSRGTRLTLHNLSNRPGTGLWNWQFTDGRTMGRLELLIVEPGAKF